MAQSPAHRFGQIVGEVLEAAVLPVLEAFARDHQLFLDRNGPRPCRSGKKCKWRDLNGNTHDLDFVLERGGTPQKVGTPAAFIETAWRRYTKHSRNKAQEIQGAIEPLVETYRNSGPFKGAVLAGHFTDGALTQLKSLGFTVLHFSYESVLTAFRGSHIDAAFDEETSDNAFRLKVNAYERLTPKQKLRITSALVKSHLTEVASFVKSLSESVSRQIERIIVLALHGGIHEVTTVEDAIQFVEKYDDDGRAKPIDRYEIEVRYNNGATIKGNFEDKISAIEFLQRFQPIQYKTK